jgi:hypothetical protein
MKPLAKHSTKLRAKKKRPKITINKRLDSIEDSAFFKKKMEKGAKMLAIAGPPEEVE